MLMKLMKGLLAVISPKDPPPLVHPFSVMYVSMDERYLYTCVQELEEEFKCLIWKRRNFSLVSSKKAARTFDRLGLGSAKISDIPNAHNGLLYLPVFRSSSDRKLIMDVWDVKKNKKKVVEKDFPSEDFFLLRNGSGDFFTSEENILHFYSNEVLLSQTQLRSMSSCCIKFENFLSRPFLWRLQTEILSH